VFARSRSVLNERSHFSLHSLYQVWGVSVAWRVALVVRAQLGDGAFDLGIQGGFGLWRQTINLPQYLSGLGHVPGADKLVVFLG
jgi:hypothetical protein